MITQYQDIFGYISAMENAYQQPIPLNGKTWCMKTHIETSELYNNSDITGQKDDMTPVKNIIRPILNLQYRTEDVDVKDVQIYVDDPNKFHLSFLVKKYHDDVFVVENDLDTFFDELGVSRIKFGGGLSKQLNRPCPEVVALQSIAFCDQTDILSSPFGIKHYYSPDQLLEMESKGWGNEKNGATATLKQVIADAQDEKRDPSNTGQPVKTPGRYIEVYEVHGNLPASFATPGSSSDTYETRIFIVCMMKNANGSFRNGAILYTALEPELPFKMIKRDPVYGRALGFGGAEELFEAQIWTNYAMIRKQRMLDSASITPIVTDDEVFANRHPDGLKGVDNLEILKKTPGTTVQKLDTVPTSIVLFERAINEWEAHAQQTGAANDAIMGESPASGTPFKLQELVTSEAHGLHEYRRGQFAKHIEIIYRDWIIPHIVRAITQGAQWLSELSMDDLQYVADCMVRNAVNKEQADRIFSGQMPMNAGEQQLFEQQFHDEFRRKGNKHFLEILKGEFRGVGLGVKVNVGGKQKNLASMVDKITNIFRFAFANPQGFIQILQVPGMAKSWNELLEFSGMSPVDFSGLKKFLDEQQPQQSQPALPSPQQLPPQLANAA